jgi:hypothetical protein
MSAMSLTYSIRGPTKRFLVLVLLLGFFLEGIEVQDSPLGVSPTICLD